MNFAEQQRNPGRHVVGIGIVIALHLLLGWALVSGLAHRLVEVIKAPIETKIIEEQKPPPPPPPENLPPPPKFAPPPPSFIPPPEVQVQAPPTPQPTISVQTERPPPAPPVSIAPPPAPVAAPPAPPAPPRVAARAALTDFRSCAPTGEDYPQAARRAEAVGESHVKVTVGADGKVISAEIVKSAGPSREHKLLDRLVVSKIQNDCAGKPGIDENGKPIGGTFEVRYVWKLD